MGNNLVINLDEWQDPSEIKDTVLCEPYGVNLISYNDNGEITYISEMLYENPGLQRELGLRQLFKNPKVKNLLPRYIDK